MYTLNHHAYCGMSGIPDTFDDRADARKAAADEIRHNRRRGRNVVTLEPGREWEVSEPENCAMIPDWAGVITLSRQTFECRECGCEHDTEHSARECCAF